MHWFFFFYFVGGFEKYILKSIVNPFLSHFFQWHLYDGVDLYKSDHYKFIIFISKFQT